MIWGLYVLNTTPTWFDVRDFWNLDFRWVKLFSSDHKRKRQFEASWKILLANCCFHQVLCFFGPDTSPSYFSTLFTSFNGHSPVAQWHRPTVHQGCFIPLAKWCPHISPIWPMKFPSYVQPIFPPPIPSQGALTCLRLQEAFRNHGYRRFTWIYFFLGTIYYL